jgi:hypothetical protein
MIRFKIRWADGKTEYKNYMSREKLEQALFKGDKDLMKSQVSMLEWADKGVQFVEDVRKEEVERHIIGADTNPFGWRKQAL